eukprot:5080076-Alexandrium_andersonii.AAC.1
MHSCVTGCRDLPAANTLDIVGCLRSHTCGWQMIRFIGGCWAWPEVACRAVFCAVEVGDFGDPAGW